MDENILQENVVQADATIDIEDNIEVFSSNEHKDITLLDTITLQAIICVIIGIIYVAVNTFMPIISSEIYDTYIEQVTVDNNTKGFDETLDAILNFFNSTPVKSHD